MRPTFVLFAMQGYFYILDFLLFNGFYGVWPFGVCIMVPVALFLHFALFMASTLINFPTFVGFRFCAFV